MIRTERLLLRAPRPDDLAALHPLFASPEAMRYWSHLPHDTPDRTRKTLDQMIASHRDTGLECVIERDGAVIGKAGFWRRWEIGYILDPSQWGLGLAREALVPLIAAAFAANPGIGPTAEIDPRNTASARLLDRLGFHETHRAARTLQIGGEWCDSVYFALSQSEFRA